MKDDRLPSVLFRNYWTDLPEILYVEFSEANPRNLPSGFGIDLIRNAYSKFFHLPYLSRKYAFSGFEKQLHKNYGTNFHQIWYNSASYYRKELRKIWHLSREKEGDLTQSYDKNPYTNRKFENQRTTHTTPPKTSMAHFALQKCKSWNFSFLFILLTRTCTPMFRIAMYLRYFHPLVYLF